MTDLTADQIIKYISDAMGTPCNYGFGDIQVDEFMCDNNAEWCEKHCPTTKDVGFEACWRRFFETLIMLDNSEGNME